VAAVSLFNWFRALWFGRHDVFLSDAWMRENVYRQGKDRP
jgi:hypothetical protein